RTCDQPGPSGDSGFSIGRSGEWCGPTGGLPQTMYGLRTIRCTSAPASCRRTALSSADCPAPTTATTRPERVETSACCEECEPRAAIDASPVPATRNSLGILA